jgi:metal-sulfur cluster biosynthetic enzyme
MRGHAQRTNVVTGERGWGPAQASPFMRRPRNPCVARLLLQVAFMSEAQPDLEARALEALGSVLDPEVGMSIVELGLVVGVAVDPSLGLVEAKLTMTSAACPLGDQIARQAEERLRAVSGVREARVELVWDPPWRPDRMSAAARKALGWGR